MTTANSTIVMPTPTGGEYRIGNDQPITFLAGPCAMESRDHAMMTAERLKGIGERVGVNIIYKTSYDKANRTSIHSPRGVGIDKAMPVFDEIRREIGLPCVTDVHTEEHCRIAGDHVDVLQIPAFLCRQTDLLVAAAKTGKVINVKKGQFLAPWDMPNVVAKIESTGNTRLLLTERGTSFGYNTLVADMRALPQMAASGYPVVMDATHSVQQPGGMGGSSGGQREFAPVMARAAVSLGIAAVFIETHQAPDTAPSDGPNMIPLDQMGALVTSLMGFDALAKSDPIRV